MNSSAHKYALLFSLFLILSSTVVPGQDVFEQDMGNGATVSSGNSGNINIAFSASDIQFGRKLANQQEFFTLQIPGFQSTDEPGLPELPVYTSMIDLSGKEIVSIRIYDVLTRRVYPGGQGYSGQLYPRQPSLTKNENPQDHPFVYDQEFYRKNVPSISDTVSVQKLGTIRGQMLSLIVINPVIYYPADNYFDLITSMTVEIETVESIQTQKPVTNTVFSSKGLLSKGISDYDEEDVTPTFSLSPAGLIILSDTLMKDHLQPLVEWKRRKGFNVTELYIGENGLERNFTSIKDTLNTIWAAADENNPQADFLIIGGDLNIVPKSEGAVSLSDMYYSEYDGNGDYLPDMYTGRLPASDTNQMKAIVDKILQYELFEFGDSISHFEETMLLAGYDDNNVVFMNGQHNYANDIYLTPGNNISNYLFLHESDNALRTANYDSAQALFDSGLGFINYTGHGSPSEWLSTGINYQFVESLSNQRRYPVIVSNACQTADFNSSTNMASAFVRANGKGALAFIGCTVNSYWNEDFWWAVGLTSINENPDYTGSDLGFYDRLFHTHNEQPSDWFTSLGQIMYAGNLAVLSSTSSKKQIYWEYYVLLGDPSIIPYIGTPSEFEVNIPDSIPLALSGITITSEPFSYAAISHFDTLWDASALDMTGNAFLSIPSGVEKDSCLLVLTGQNMKPFIKTLYFAEPDTAWLDILEIIPTDNTGNANDTADCGETLRLDVTVQNVGLEDAIDTYMKLSSDSEYITIGAPDSVFIGVIGQLSEVDLIDKFGIIIDDSIPDKEFARFELKVYYGPNIVAKTFDVKLHSPIPSIISYITDDTSLGNGNMRPEPGESMDIIISIANNGSSRTSGTLTVNSQSAYLSFGNTSLSTGVLLPGDTVMLSFSASLEPSTPDGQNIVFDAILDCNPYEATANMGFVAGGSIEDFETANFMNFPWENSGTFPWLITSTDSYNNLYSAMSGLTITDDNQESQLKIMLNTPVDGTLSFWYKVSSEYYAPDPERYGDFFLFEIDDSTRIKTSGEVPWTRAEYDINKGVHHLTWTYRKDPNTYEGSDKVWLDMIQFPLISFNESDLSVDSLVSPSEPTKDYGNEQIIARVLNLGRDTIYSLPLSYRVNTSTPVDELFGVQIYPGDSATVTFVQTANLDNEGEYTIRVYRTAPDDYELNDTVLFTLLSTDIFDIITGSDDFSIGPVPFDISTYITSHIVLGEADLSLYDGQGKKVWTHHSSSIFEGERIEINGDLLSSGLYILKIDCELGSYLYKLIKR